MTISKTVEFAAKTVIEGEHVQAEVDTRTQRHRGFIETSIFFADSGMIVFASCGSDNIIQAVKNHLAAVVSAQIAVDRYR